MAAATAKGKPAIAIHKASGTTDRMPNHAPRAANSLISPPPKRSLCPTIIPVTSATSPPQTCCHHKDPLDVMTKCAGASKRMTNGNQFGISRERRSWTTAIPQMITGTEIRIVSFISQTPLEEQQATTRLTPISGWSRVKSFNGQPQAYLYRTQQVCLRLTNKPKTVQKVAGTLRVPSAKPQKALLLRATAHGMCLLLCFVERYHCETRTTTNFPFHSLHSTSTRMLPDVRKFARQHQLEPAVCVDSTA